MKIGKKKHKIALLSARNQMLFYVYVLIVWSFYQWFVHDDIGMPLMILMIGLTIHLLSFFYYRNKNKDKTGPDIID